MTVNNLRDQVLTLGFEAVMEDEEAFINSANRALGQIFSELSYENRLQFYHYAKKPCFVLKEYTHTAGTSNTVTLHGKAMSFKASGEGTFKLKTGANTEEVSFSSPYTVIRRFISDGTTITFTGPLSYRVFDFACYDSITSDEEEKIPTLSETSAVNISLLVSDFLSISKPPKNASGYDIEGASVMGCRLYLPADYSGEVILYYRKRPMTLFSDSEGDIDIPEESAWLLPLLVSAYLWLDDDSAKAQYYMQLFRDGINRLKSEYPRFINTAYSDVLGWC